MHACNIQYRPTCDRPTRSVVFAFLSKAETEPDVVVYLNRNDLSAGGFVAMGTIIVS